MPDSTRELARVQGSVTPSDAGESVWSLAAFWVVAFTGAGLFAAVMIAPRWEQKQLLAARVRVFGAQCSSLSDNNTRLAKVIEAFKHDPDFNKEMARYELGYVQPDEQRLPSPVRNFNRAKPPEPDTQPVDLWSPFVRLFAHDRLVRETALISAAVFIVVGLALFNPRPER